MKNEMKMVLWNYSKLSKEVFRKGKAASLSPKHRKRQ